MSQAKGSTRVREVVVQYDDGTEEVVAGFLTTDAATVDFARQLAHQHAGRHAAVEKGYTLPPEHRPGIAVVARGLDKWPHQQAFYPAVLHTFRELRVRLPARPTVHDYRSKRGQEIRESHQLHPWDLPHVQALAARFNWPAP